MTSVTINGNTYTDDSDPTTGMGNGGHRTRFIPCVSDVVVVAGDVATDQATVAADKAIVAADKAIVAADKATVIADKGIVNTDKGIVSADKATVIADKAIVAADKATVIADKAIVLGYKNDAQTAATTATTQAGLAATSASDAAADAAAADADRVTVAADKATVAADKAIVIADKATVAADKAIVAADKAIVAADKATTLGYKNDAATSASNASTSATNAYNSELAAAAYVGILRTVGNNLTATGSDQTGALLLANDENIVSTVSASTGVRLPVPAAGKIIYVFNTGANPLKVYPASGNSFNTLANDAAITLAVGGILNARANTTSHWNVETNQISNLLIDGALNMGGKSISGHSMLSHDAPIVLGSTSGTINVDWSVSSYYILDEPTGAITFTFTDPPANTKLQLKIRSDGTSTAYAFTFPSSVDQFGTSWTGTTANKKAVLNFDFTDGRYDMMGASQV
jgi:hypothetical protein